MIENESQQIEARLAQLEAYERQVVEIEKSVTNEDAREFLAQAADPKWVKLFTQALDKGDQEALETMRYFVAFHRLGGGVHKFMQETFQNFPTIVNKEPAHHLVKHLAMYYKHYLGVRPDQV